ncbi:hypothetical protein ACOSP7_020577 [Xanthoceras sorbifolium]
MKYSPTLPTQKNRQPESTYKNRVVNTKRTILSPFTKEYRVFATLNGIPLFFWRSCIKSATLNNSSSI